MPMIPSVSFSSARKSGGVRLLWIGSVAFVLAGCVITPEGGPGMPREAAPPPPPTRVYFYPTAGQSAEQQERDRYECYRWAVKQSGFDPSLPTPAPHQRIEVVPAAPPGQSTAAGAVAGALLGAVMAGPRDAPEGAVIGAIAGAAIGAAADASQQEQAARAQRRHDQRGAQDYARVEQQAQNYRRAMSACLDGRGYAVQ